VGRQGKLEKRLWRNIGELVLHPVIVQVWKVPISYGKSLVLGRLPLVVKTLKQKVAQDIGDMRQDSHTSICPYSLELKRKERKNNTHKCLTN
jgi:hypothetical protein